LRSRRLQLSFRDFAIEVFAMVATAKIQKALLNVPQLHPVTRLRATRARMPYHGADPKHSTFSMESIDKRISPSQNEPAN